MIVTIIRACNIKNTQILGSMNPYSVVRCGKRWRRSRVCSSGGVNPVWNQKLPTFGDVSGQTEVIFKIYNKRTIRSNQLLGTVVACIKRLPGGLHPLNLVLIRPNGKERGFIQVTIYLERPTRIVPKYAILSPPGPQETKETKTQETKETKAESNEEGAFFVNDDKASSGVRKRLRRPPGYYFDRVWNRIEVARKKAAEEAAAKQKAEEEAAAKKKAEEEAAAKKKAAEEAAEKRTTENSKEILSAVIEGDVAKFKLLIAAGADLNVRDEYGQTALMGASTLGKTKWVELLIAAGADLNVRNDKHGCALSLASECDHTECVKLLIGAGADLNVYDNSGWTALHWASTNNNPECVKLLIDAGADVNVHSNAAETALFLASKWGEPECVKLLHSRWSRPNYPQQI